MESQRAGETVERAKAGAHENIEKVKSAAHESVESVRTGAHETVEKVQAGAHQAVDMAAQATTKATETISAKSDQLVDAEERLRQHVREYVRENPVTSLGIAFGSGFILSRLMGHR